ncbi:glucokinase [Lentilitoribacter sp. EG35]
MFLFPVLIGDIGGTNSRFALIEKPDAPIRHFDSTKNTNFSSIQDVIEESVFTKTDLRPKTLIIAVAGPTGNPKGIKLTNCPWEINPNALLGTLNLNEIIAVSDFEAQALAAIATDTNEHMLIKSGKDHPTSARSVLGPGTGLGMAGMIYCDGEWSVIPGEGGFVDIGPRTARDSEIFEAAFGQTERPAAELFLSGRGLTNLYNAICKADGIENRIEDPANVTAAYNAGNDKSAQETMELFATYLGRYASDAALIYLARGGIYLTGGVAQKLGDVIKTPFFLDAFADKDPYGDIVAEIPVYLMTDPLIALAGLYAFANRPEQFRISRQGRYWTK